MKIVVFFIILLIGFISGIAFSLIMLVDEPLPDSSSDVKGVNQGGRSDELDPSEIVLTKEFDLDNNGIKERLYFHRTRVEPFAYYTDVVIEGTYKPSLVIPDYFWEAEEYQVNKNLRVLLTQSQTGHIVSIMVYKYNDGVFSQIPIKTDEYINKDQGDVGSDAEMKDMDSDGTLELLIYFRHYPPEKKRTVKIYKFDGQVFTKTESYDQKTEEVYL